MWNGKNKALTFSYDDGVEQDIRLVDIFNKYGLKCTFNLNSGIMTPKSRWMCGLKEIRRMAPDGLPELYKGHEIAAHCYTHANLCDCSDKDALRELMLDKSALEELFGCKIRGMAYPYGVFDDRVVELVEKCGFEYARTVDDSHSLDIPRDLLRYGASCHHNFDGIDRLVDEFIAYDGDEPKLLCIWGHSYEFDLHENWERFEEICARLSGRDDVFYGTNAEVYLG